MNGTEDPAICPPFDLFLLLDDKSTNKSPKTLVVADAIATANDEVPHLTDSGSDFVEEKFGSFNGKKHPVESSRMTWNRKNPCTCFVPKCSVLIEINLNSTVLTEYGPSFVGMTVGGWVDAAVNVAVVVPVGAVGTTMVGVTMCPSCFVVVWPTGLDDIVIPVFRVGCDGTMDGEGTG